MFSDIKIIALLGGIAVALIAFGVTIHSYNNAIKQNAALTIENGQLKNTIKQNENIEKFLQEQRQKQDEQILESKRIIEEKSKQLDDLSSMLAGRKDSNDAASEYFKE